MKFKSNSKWLFLFIAVILISHFSANAAPKNKDLKKLDSYFQKALKDWQVPGMAIAIVKDGKIVLEKGYGVKEVHKSGTVDENTLFAIASNSKAFTAAALAILVDQGKITWDDHVKDYLPYFQLYDSFATNEMRIRDILSHRSGLGTYSGDLLWYGTNYSAEEVIKRVRYLKPKRIFRSQYGYSNIMFVVAGKVIEAVSGLNWRDFVQKNFFDKLGMTKTVTSVADLAGKSNVANPHKEIDGKIVPIDWYNWDSMAAAGGIISSVHDMSNWLLLQLNHGNLNGIQIFSENTSRTMWTPHISFEVSESNEKLYPSTHFRAYGLGWNLMDYQGRKVMSHGGGYDGMFSRVALVPEEKLGLVILTNSMTGISTALSYQIMDFFFGKNDHDWSSESLQKALKNKEKKQESLAKWNSDRVTGTKPSLGLSDYSGMFRDKMYGNAEVKLENGKLVLALLPNPDLVGDLTHWHYDTFKITWRKRFAWFDEGKVQFIMNNKGEIVKMKLDVPNEDFWFDELDFRKVNE